MSTEVAEVLGVSGTAAAKTPAEQRVVLTQEAQHQRRIPPCWASCLSP